MEYLLAGCPFEFPLPSLRGASSHGPWNLAGKENSRCQKAVQLCSRLFPDICSSLSFDHVDPLPHLETILFRPLCINTGHHFLIVAFYLFLRKFFPACLPYVANDRITHVPKKIKACILFLLLTVPAALGAVWCAKHAYRYHLAVHPLPYSPEQGALLEKHRQDKRNARLNPHAPVLFLGSSTMEFWLKEGKHSWETWFSPLGCLNLGTRSETTGNLLWRLNDGLTSPLAPRIIVLYSGVNNLGVQKSLGWTAFQGNVAIVKKIREIYSPETTAIIVIPPLIAQKGSRMETFRNCLLQHDFGENVHVLPLHFFLPGKDASLYTWDGLHLNALGYEAISPPLFRFLQQLLSRSSF